MTRTPLAALAALGLALLLPASAAAVTVSPAPNTPTASYKTNIAFRGAAPSALGSIRVTGSRSGRHAGRLQAHSDGQGASFVVAKDFRRGERVTVTTGLDITGASNGKFSFKVVGLGNASAISVGMFPETVAGAGPRRRFRSRPDLIPPATTIQRRPEGIAPGELFINSRNRTARGQQGPIILDETGEMVFWKAVGNREKVADVRVQTFRGKPVLTYWQGAARQGGGSGEGVVLDTGYKQVARVKAGNGYRLDLHEFQLTPQGTALVTIYNPITRDLSAMGGSSRGRVVDGIVQEIDLATGLVIFEWHSLGTIALNEAYSRPKRNRAVYFDYFHINSISPDTDGNLLISARDTWAAYKLDRQTGRVIWRMNGKKSDFKMGRGTEFAYQHDVERRTDGTISVFDNSAAPPVRKESRGLILDVDEAARTVRLVRAITHPRKLLAANQGSMQELPNGNVLIGWGSQRAYSEHSPDGRLVFDGRLSTANDTYRAYRQDWTALPRGGRPAIAVDGRGSQRTAVYASFNGATEIATWEVLAGRSASSLAPVGSGRKVGFETTISAPSAGPFFAVRAKDASGAVLGTSKVVRR